MDNAFARLPIPHFFRWLILNIVLFFAYVALIVPGVYWQTQMLKRTAYRTVDWLWILFVPIAGPIVSIRTQWRYCAREAYWAPASPQMWAEPVAA